MAQPNEEKVSEGDAFQPGQTVPVIGNYECASGCGHRWSTNVTGHRFPPMNDGCSGYGWIREKALLH
jgi:hypothetical protein